MLPYLNGFLEISARNLNDHDVIKRYIVQVKIGVTYRMLAVSLKFVNMEIGAYSNFKIVNYMSIKIFHHPLKKIIFATTTKKTGYGTFKKYGFEFLYQE